MRTLHPTGTALVACVMLLLTSFDSPAAQGAADPWYEPTRPRGTKWSTVSFSGMFSVDLPSGWLQVAGYGMTIFTAVEKRDRGALIAVQHMLLQDPVGPELLPEIGKMFLGDIQASESSGKRFDLGIKKGRQGDFILIQYNRQGLSGVENHVAQYSIPVGTTMYRLICVAPAAEIEQKYRQIFAHVAASFTPGPTQ